MFGSNLKQLAVEHPRLSLTTLLIGLLLLAGVDPVAAGDVSINGGVSVGLGP